MSTLLGLNVLYQADVQETPGALYSCSPQKAGVQSIKSRKVHDKLVCQPFAGLVSVDPREIATLPAIILSQFTRVGGRPVELSRKARNSLFSQTSSVIELLDSCFRRNTAGLPVVG